MWVNEFFLSARGESTQSWLETPKTRRAKVPYPAVKILFPTAQYVRESVLGESVRLARIVRLSSQELKRRA